MRRTVHRTYYAEPIRLQSVNPAHGNQSMIVRPPARLSDKTAGHILMACVCMLAGGHGMPSKRHRTLLMCRSSDMWVTWEGRQAAAGGFPRRIHRPRASSKPASAPEQQQSRGTRSVWASTVSVSVRSRTVQVRCTAILERGGGASRSRLGGTGKLCKGWMASRQREMRRAGSSLLQDSSVQQVCAISGPRLALFAPHTLVARNRWPALLFVDCVAQVLRSMVYALPLPSRDASTLPVPVSRQETAHNNKLAPK